MHFVSCHLGPDAACSFVITSNFLVMEFQIFFPGNILSQNMHTFKDGLDS
jgi:hypothetical protein